MKRGRAGGRAIDGAELELFKSMAFDLAELDSAKSHRRPTRRDNAQPLGAA